MGNSSGVAKAMITRQAVAAGNNNAAISHTMLPFLKRLLSIAFIFSITSNRASSYARVGVVAAAEGGLGIASEESNLDRHHQPQSAGAGAESPPSTLHLTPRLIRNRDRFDAQHGKSLGRTILISSLTGRIEDDGVSLAVHGGKNERQHPSPQQPRSGRRMEMRQGLLDAKKQRRGRQVADPSPMRSPDEQQIHLSGRTREHDMALSILRTADDNFDRADEHGHISASPPLMSTEENDVGISTSASVTTKTSSSIEEQLPPYKLTTSFDGTKMGYGIMFDLTAASSPSSSCSSFTSITIESIDVHLSLNNNNIPIRLYVTPNTYSGKEHSPSEWELVADHVVRGQGRNYPTPIPGEAFHGGRKIELTPGETIGMYVTLVEGAHTVYSTVQPMTRGGENATTAGAFDDNNGTDREKGLATAKSNCHLSVSTGVGVKFLFGDAFQGRDFNGVLRYRLHYDDQQLLSGEGIGGRGNVSLQQQQQQPPLALHSLDLAEERRRQQGNQQGDSAVANNHERRATSHGIFFDVFSASRSETDDGDISEAGGVTTIRGMALRTVLRAGEWARVEVYTKSGSYERRRSSGGGRDDDAENESEGVGVGGEWLKISDEFVHGGDGDYDNGGDASILPVGSDQLGGAGHLSPFVEPVRILDGDDGVQSFFVVLSSPVLLSTIVTDDLTGTEHAASSSAVLKVISGRSVDSYPAHPSSTPSSSGTTPFAGEEGSNEGGRRMLFDGILLYSSTISAHQENGDLTPTPSPTPATAVVTPYPTPSSLVSTYTESKNLTTGYDFADERLSHGNIFDVVADDLSGPIVITTLSFHVDLRQGGNNETGGGDEDIPTTTTSASSYGVKVYSKPGTYLKGVDDWALWEKVADLTLFSTQINDEGRGTMIPMDRFRNVLVEAGSTRAFLLLFSTPNVVTSPYVDPTGGTPSSYSSLGGAVSVTVDTSDADDDATVYASNSEISVLVGSGVGRYGFDVAEKRHFDDLFHDRVWHGTVHYRTTATETTTPTMTPTIEPTSNHPTPSPTTQRTPTPTRPDALTHRTDRELLTTWLGGAAGRRCEFDLRIADEEERNKHGGGGAIVVRSLDVAVARKSSDTDLESILHGISILLKEGGAIGDGDGASDAPWTERSSTAALLQNDDGKGDEEGQRGYFVIRVKLDAPLVLLPDGRGARMAIGMPTPHLVYTEVGPDIGVEGDIYASNIDVGLLVGVCSTTGGDDYHQDNADRPITSPDGVGDDTAAIPSKGVTVPGVFNGIVHYSVRTSPPTSAPTDRPTQSPTVPTAGTGGGTTKAVVAQQMITLKGVSRRRLLGGQGIRLLASILGHPSPVLEDERAVEVFEVTVLGFVDRWIRRTNPTLAVRQVVVSTDVTDDEVTLLYGGEREEGEGDVRGRRRRSLADHASSDAPSLRSSLRGSVGRAIPSTVAAPLSSSSSWFHNIMRRALLEEEDADVGDPLSLNVYTTITGDYTPPPDVVFDNLVEETFMDNGDVFVRELSEDPAFEEVTAVEARTVRFPLPHIPTTSSDDGAQNNFFSFFSPGSSMGPVFIAMFVVGGLAVVLLICGCAFFAVRRRRKKEKQGRNLVQESARVRSVTDIYDDDRHHHREGTDAASGTGGGWSEEDTTDDDSEELGRAEGRRRLIANRSAASRDVAATGNMYDDDRHHHREGTDAASGTGGGWSEEDTTDDDSEELGRAEGRRRLIANRSAASRDVAATGNIDSEDGDNDNSNADDDKLSEEDAEEERFKEESTEQERKKGPVLAPRTRTSISRRRQRKKRTDARVTPRKKKVKASAA